MKKKTFLNCCLLTFVFALFTAGTLASSATKESAEKECGAEIKGTYWAEVTGYYKPEPGQEKYVSGSYAGDKKMNGPGIETYSGTVPGIGTAAADWKKLKKGTQFRIRQCNVQVGSESPRRMCDVTFTVLDTGSALKRSRKISIDIFMGSGDKGRKQAEKLGRQQLLIEVTKCVPQK